VTSTDREYFHELYASSSDPWNFATSWYERRKYALTVATLPRTRYRSAFEPGCSIGILSELLAPRCERLLATDINSTALEQASERLKNFAGVEVEHRAIPESWPSERFDLVVLSELAYYFDVATLDIIVADVIKSMLPESHLIGVHWRGKTNYPLTGDQAHHQIGECKKLRRVVHHLEEHFVLDLWERVA
jgi:SAM-dependent methyltransferase